MKYFRIDDISINTSEEKLIEMIFLLDQAYSDSKFLLGISPLVCNMKEYKDKRNERIFPSIYNAYSDHRIFYKVDECGIPNVVNSLIKTYGNKIVLAGHGLIHVDHRLLTKEVQELSIIVSCNLIGAKYYIPPFNKWNHDTNAICQEFGIKLVKFEDGWKHLGYETINNDYTNYYFHTHDFTIETFKAMLEKSK